MTTTNLQYQVVDFCNAFVLKIAWLDLEWTNRGALPRCSSNEKFANPDLVSVPRGYSDLILFYACAHEDECPGQHTHWTLMRTLILQRELTLGRLQDYLRIQTVAKLFTPLP